MPVILDDDAQDSWLRRDARPAALKEMLVPFPGSMMKSFPVSSRANSAEADDAQLVEEVEIREEPTTGLLF